MTIFSYPYSRCFNLSRETYVFLFVFISFFASQVEAANPVDFMTKLKTAFISIVSEQQDEFQICEIYSKTDDKRAFLNRVFRTRIFSQANKIDYVELFVSYMQSPGRLHLGIIALTYDTEENAKKVYDFVATHQQEYFETTKILTKYRVNQQKNIVLFIYSETFLRDELKLFFQQIHEISEQA